MNMEPMNKRSISYIYSDILIKECDRIPQVLSRASLVHSLIDAYGLLPLMKIVTPRCASEDELNSFHSKAYIEYLQTVNDTNDLEKHEEDQLEYGLGYDCPLLEKMYDFVKVIAGSTLSAAEEILESSQISVNWCGGWHHAQRDEAEGFSYVNDIVIAIIKLLQKYDRVLYIDLDLHHGNGVQNAFACTSKVMTLSFHYYAPGFYPGSGGLTDVGFAKGKYYSVNVPLREGIRDENYFYIFDKVTEKLYHTFRPQVAVVQCGADVIHGDPLGATFNLTPKGIGKCVEKILSWNLPSMFVGGGGYHNANTARCWAYLTSIINNYSIPSIIPEHTFFTEYGPAFELEVTPGLRRDENSRPYMDIIINSINKNMDHLCDDNRKQLMQNELELLKQ